MVILETPDTDAHGSSAGVQFEWIIETQIFGNPMRSEAQALSLAQVRQGQGGYGLVAQFSRGANRRGLADCFKAFEALSRAATILLGTRFAQQRLIKVFFRCRPLFGFAGARPIRIGMQPPLFAYPAADRAAAIAGYDTVRAKRVA